MSSSQSQTAQCPYCRASGPARCTTTQPPLSRAVSECSACARIVLERHLHTHPFFPLLPSLHPLPLVTPDLAAAAVQPSPDVNDDDDRFLPAGFVSAFSAFSLERHPVLARSASAFSGLLPELVRALAVDSAASSTADPAGPMVSVDSLRAYLQIVDVASILRLDRDIADHAFELFKDCSSATCLRNRSVEALATAALVQAIREAQEPRTLQEISTASNLPQKEIGKYIKILGESLKLSQPLNSNSIAVHMPRFCSLLQLNKSAQELAAHIGEVVVNKCFCTRRNPISISAAAIYLACQLEDKRKTQAEICKVTGLTEVTLRKVYKELLENWDDLLPPGYTPATPPEKAFPMTTIYSGRSSSGKDLYQDKILDSVKQKGPEPPEPDHMVIVKEEEDKKTNALGRPAKLEPHDSSKAFWQPNASSSASTKCDKMETNVRGFNLNEAMCAMDCDRADIRNTLMQMSRTSIIIKFILGLLSGIMHLVISIFNLWPHLTFNLQCYLISCGLLWKYWNLNLGRLKYLAIVVDSKEAKNTAKIKQLLRWLSTIGVKYVCIYDIEGVLKQSFDPARNVSRDGNWGEYLDIGANIKAVKFRHKEMVIDCISGSDGKEGIAKAASLLCSTCLNGSTEDNSKKEPVFTEADMANALKAIGCGGPEPDLLLMYGPVRCHLGFPAWRLRYTEIMHMGPLKSMKYGALVKALYTFSKKHQNYGK